jgi:hypothetical protein
MAMRSVGAGQGMGYSLKGLNGQSGQLFGLEFGLHQVPHIGQAST